MRRGSVWGDELNSGSLDWSPESALTPQHSSAALPRAAQPLLPAVRAARWRRECLPSRTAGPGIRVSGASAKILRVPAAPEQDAVEFERRSIAQPTALRGSVLRDGIGRDRKSTRL